MYLDYLVVRQTKGPIAQSNESRRTLRDPDTAICPSCSVNLSPIIDKLSPKNNVFKKKIFFKKIF